MSAVEWLSQISLDCDITFRVAIADLSYAFYKIISKKCIIVYLTVQGTTPNTQPAIQAAICAITSASRFECG